MFSLGTIGLEKSLISRLKKIGINLAEREIRSIGDDGFRIFHFQKKDVSLALIMITRGGKMCNNFAIKEINCSLKDDQEMALANRSDYRQITRTSKSNSIKSLKKKDITSLVSIVDFSFLILTSLKKNSPS